MTAAKKSTAPKWGHPAGVEIPCLRVRDDEPWRPPQRFHPGDAGADLMISRHVTVGAGTRAQLPTNLAVAIPEGYYGQIIGRSSTFHKRGLIVVTGVVDPGYRGEVMIVVYNPTTRSTFVQEGERLAQIILLPVAVGDFTASRTLPKGDRAEKGFGSTGGFPGDPMQTAEPEKEE